MEARHISSSEMPENAGFIGLCRTGLEPYP